MQAIEFRILLYPRAGGGPTQQVQISAANSFDAKRLAETQYGGNYHVIAVMGGN